HLIKLPPEFVSDTRRGAPATPPKERSSSEEHADDSDWIAWARAFRRPETSALLEEARRAVDRACEAKWEAEGARLEAERGTEARACPSAGCGRPAITTKALCGRCIARMNAPWHRHASEYEEIRRLCERIARP